MDDIAAIVLAAGKGVRMQSDLPKVLQPLAGKPLIIHVLESLRQAGISDICVVVGYKGELVVDAIHGLARHVWQREQRGTGHAVMQAEHAFAGYDGGIIVACGDVPLIRPETFMALAEAGREESVKAVVLTMVPDDPTGYGRVVTDGEGNFVRIVEEKDATDEERGIGIVNAGTYYFDAPLLFKGLRHITSENAQGEYYLPDVLSFLVRSGDTVRTFLLDDPVEGSGVNTREELLMLEKRCARAAARG